MKATDELKHEHDAILLMLEIMDRAAARLEAGQDVPVADLEAMVDFLKTFADGCHHAKEEGYLFPAMEKAGVPREHGPIGVMLSEHEIGRSYISKITEAIAAIRSGSNGFESHFAKNARGYGNLLRMHIQKENMILFAIADQRLSAADDESIVAGFEKIENEKVGAGKHEAYHALLRRLKDTYCVSVPISSSPAESV